MEFRLAQKRDLAELAAIDRHVTKETLKKIIEERRVFVAINDGVVIACIRYNLFWDLIPFMNLIEVKESEQRKGLGTKLLAFYEKHLKESGYKKCLTSTFSSEGAQHFYRKNGYKDIGGLVLPNEPLEIMLYKEF